MKPRIQLVLMHAALALPLFLTGCDREVSHTGSAKVNSDGSSKSSETTVKVAPDGTVTKQETDRKTDSDGDSSSKTKTTTQTPSGSETKTETKTSTPGR